MSASIENLLEEIKRVERNLESAKVNGDNVEIVRCELALKTMMKTLHNANVLNEGKVLKG